MDFPFIKKYKDKAVFFAKARQLKELYAEYEEDICSTITHFDSILEGLSVREQENLIALTAASMICCFETKDEQQQVCTTIMALVKQYQDVEHIL